MQQVSLSTAPSSRSEDIALPALTCYTLQMGVFSSAENAQKQSDTLKSQGAGGYVLQDGDRYRVLAAGYALELSLIHILQRLAFPNASCYDMHMRKISCFQILCMIGVGLVFLSGCSAPPLVTATPAPTIAVTPSPSPSPTPFPAEELSQTLEQLFQDAFSPALPEQHRCV